MVSLSLLRHRCFLVAATLHVFTKNCSSRDDLLRARDPNTFALLRIAEAQFTTATAFLEPTTQTPLRSHALECSHRPVFMILPHFVEMQLCFQEAHPPSNSDFQLGHVFKKRTAVTLATPSVKRKSLCPNSPPQPRNVETQTND